MIEHTEIPEGSTITVTYDPRYADPGPNGEYTFTGVFSDSVPSGFDFTPDNGEDMWSITAGELARGVATIVHIVTPPQRVILGDDAADPRKVAALAGAFPADPFLGLAS